MNWTYYHGWGCQPQKCPAYIVWQDSAFEVAKRPLDIVNKSLNLSAGLMCIAQHVGKPVVEIRWLKSTSQIAGYLFPYLFGCEFTHGTFLRWGSKNIKAGDGAQVR